MDNIFEDLKRVDENIASLQKELKSGFVKPEVLKRLLVQLQEIEAFIDAANDPKTGGFLREEIEKHQEMLISLFGRWHTLFVDAEVTQIAEEAQKLSEQSDERDVHEELDALEKRIAELSKNEAFSEENRLMMTMTRRFIAKAFAILNKDKLVLDSPRDPLMEIESGETAIMLYEIAHEIYDGSIKKGLNQFHLIGGDVKGMILRHFHHLGGNMQAFDGDGIGEINRNAFFLIQSLLVSIKETVQGIFDGHYPDRAEVADLLDVECSP